MRQIAPKKVGHGSAAFLAAGAMRQIAPTEWGAARQPSHGKGNAPDRTHRVGHGAAAFQAVGAMRQIAPK